MFELRLFANVAVPSACAGKIHTDAKRMRTNVHKTNQIEPTNLNAEITLPSACGGKVKWKTYFSQQFNQQF